MPDGMEAFGTEVPQSKHNGHDDLDIGLPAGPDDKARIAMTAKRWSVNGNIYWPANETTDTMPAGFYEFESSNIGPYARKKDIATDGLLELPDSAAEEVINEFKEFWALEPEFKKRGFLHKRGILLYGPPGGGKTSSLMLMARELVNKYDGIVCSVEHPGLAAACLSNIRQIEPERPIVAILEDIDSLIEQYDEQAFLSLLDGETQVNRICYVGTTNYPERLDKRFVDRPSRFDTIKKIGMPTAAAREVYLSNREPELVGEELAMWVDRTDGLAIAHLRELVILVKCFGKPFETAIKRLEDMRVKKHTSDDEKGSVGFGVGIGR